MSSKNTLVAALLLAAALMSGCGAQPSGFEDIRPVRTMTVSPPQDAASANYSGEIRARRESAMGFQVAGRVSRRLVEIGDKVVRGQALLQLDPVDATLNAQASKAQLDSARSQLAQAQSDLDRYEALAEKHFVGRSELEKARLSQLTAAQSLKAAEANYRVAANQASYTSLVAGAAGTVTAIDVEVGQVVQAGQIVVHVAEDGERELLVSVPESRVQELRSAGAMRIELWVNPQRRYTGKLREMAPDTDSVTRTYAARISLLDADAEVRLGMTAKLSVELPQFANMRVVPLTAIHDTDGTPTVWVVDAGGDRVASRRVTLADVRKDAVLVSAGLADGERVVTAGVNLLHEGQKVRMADPHTTGKG